MPDLLTKHLVITGRVQKVGYRNYMTYKARQFQITGWVRNCLDGSVEAMVQGAPENVEAIITRAHRGPPKAEVTSVIVSEGHGDYATFETLPTT
jgi:acylphosphatase